MTEIADAIVELVKSRTGASFAEFQRLLAEEGFETEGSWASELPGNLILWTGMSEELEIAVRECVNTHRIHWHGLGEWEAIMVHLADGRMPRLPIAKKPPKDGYKEPHWIPVVWYPGAGCSAKNCGGIRPKAKR